MARKKTYIQRVSEREGKSVRQLRKLFPATFGLPKKKKRTMSIQAVIGAVTSPRTPAGLKKGLIKKYRRELQAAMGRSQTLVRKLKQMNPVNPHGIRMRKRYKGDVPPIKFVSYSTLAQVLKEVRKQPKTRKLLEKLKQRNPGAAWHVKHAATARRLQDRTTGEVSSIYAGDAGAHEFSARTAKKMGMNPRGGTVIYDQVLRVEARKGKGSLYPGEKFYHNFGGKTKAKIIGMPDGSLRIVGKKPLWKPIKQR